MSKTRFRKPPLDLLSGAPLWLPLKRLRYPQDGHEGFAWFSERWSLDTTTALELARQAGLTPNSTFPELPAEAR